MSNHAACINFAFKRWNVFFMCKPAWLELPWCRMSVLLGCGRHDHRNRKGGCCSFNGCWLYKSVIASRATAKMLTKWHSFDVEGKPKSLMVSSHWGSLASMAVRVRQRDSDLLTFVGWPRYRKPPLSRDCRAFGMLQGQGQNSGRSSTPQTNIERADMIRDHRKENTKLFNFAPPSLSQADGPHKMKSVIVEQSLRREPVTALLLSAFPYCCRNRLPCSEEVQSRVGWQQLFLWTPHFIQAYAYWHDILRLTPFCTFIVAHCHWLHARLSPSLWPVVFRSTQNTENWKFENPFEIRWSLL